MDTEFNPTKYASEKLADAYGKSLTKIQKSGRQIYPLPCGEEAHLKTRTWCGRPRYIDNPAFADMIERRNRINDLYDKYQTPRYKALKAYYDQTMEDLVFVMQFTSPACIQQWLTKTITAMEMLTFPWPTKDSL